MNQLARIHASALLLGCQLVAVMGDVSAATLTSADSTARICLVATGLGGLPEYQENFVKWGDLAEELCQKDLGAEVIRLDGSSSRRDRFQEAFERMNTSLGENGECWIFLIGHGSYDGRDYKFNISGPDLLGSDLARFFQTLGGRRIYAILATSSSGVLTSRLSGPNRVVISATRSEHERLAPLFISFFLESARSAEADLDKNGAVSLKEAFALSEAAIQDWYSDRKRLQTEHPVLDDSGGTGRLASQTHLSKPPEQSYRSLEARRLLPERVRLEREVEELKLRKGEMAEAEYFGRLEALLVELAILNERIRQLEGEE